MPKEPIKNAPASERTPWPPTDYFSYVDCNLDQNWWTLAKIAGRTDPWAVIEYNFATRDPNVVNWYLFHKLGCNVTTPDGSNYRFGKYKPGTTTPDPSKKFRIYLPFHDWAPSTSSDDTARNMVIQTLTSGAAAKTHFTLGGYTLHYMDLGRVASLIDERRIGIRVNPKYGNMAFYLPAAAFSTKGMSAGDTMYLSFDRPISMGHLALIVHESVHAAFDARPVRGISNEASEGMAYVAQSLYAWHRGQRTPLEPVDGDLLAKKILEKSWTIATTLAARGTPARDDIRDLHTAISLHPEYRDKPRPHYRGVR